MPEPIVSHGTEPESRIAARGETLCVYEWRGSGPAALHVHFEDDEAWHVLEGTLRFRFADSEVAAGPGSTVFVPAGVAHTYEAVNARYLIILTPRLELLIRALQQELSRSVHEEIYRNHRSQLLE